MHLTCLHAPAVCHLRQRLWEEVRQISSCNNLPWLCVGDFNDILYLWEKVGKHLTYPHHMFSFHELLNDCSLMDLGSKGYAYTWINNWDGEDIVKERLDKMLCTEEWRLTYPYAEVLALLAIGPDHSPFLLSIEASRVRNRWTFYFESYWLQDKECRYIIGESRASHQLGSESLPQKLSVVFAVLSNWSRSKFTNARQQINFLWY